MIDSGSKEARSLLTAGLSDRDRSIRFHAALGLVESAAASPRIHEVLTEMLQEEDLWRRCSAALAFGHLGAIPPAATERLRDLLYDPEYRVRECALEALDKVTARGNALERGSGQADELR